MGWNLHIFLVNITWNAIPVPGFEQLVLQVVDRDGAVHTLHLFFSVPIYTYYVYQSIFSLVVYINKSGLALVLDIPVEAFVVQRSQLRGVTEQN